MADCLVDADKVALVVRQGGGLQVRLPIVRHVPLRKICKADVPLRGDRAGLHLLLKAGDLPVELLLHLPGRQLFVGGPDEAVADLLAVEADPRRYGDPVPLPAFLYGRHGCSLTLLSV